MAAMGSLFARMIGTLAVLLVIGVIIGESDVLQKLEKGERSLRYSLMSGFMGGILGIYGNLAGVDISGAVVSVRDVGPMFAGFVGGPIGGLVAGLIAGAHRLTLGGITAQACIIATCLIGLICGILSRKYRERIIKPQWALLVGVLMECMHLGIVLIMVKPFETAVEIVEQIALPFITINAAGFVALTFFIRSVEKRRLLSAEQNRIQTELNAASVIQRSLLPPITDIFPGREEIDVAASMEAARSVGGDFYDIFFVDKDTFAVVIADVSGKGIPAALFMVNAKQTIQNCVRDIPDLAKAVTTANESLCANNEMEMFVTAWIGLLDLKTGQLRYVNAGHNPPLIVKPDSTEFLRGRHGFVMGGMEGIAYPEQTAKLDPEDKLYLYTDGVTEAEDSGHELFGEDRLVAALQEACTLDAAGVLGKVNEEIAAHVKGCDQFDDITMMCLAYQPQSSSSVGT